MTVPEWHESKIAVNLHPAGSGLTSMSWLFTISNYPLHSLPESTHTTISKTREYKAIGLTIIIDNQTIIMIINRTNRFIIIIPFITIEIFSLGSMA